MTRTSQGTWHTLTAENSGLPVDYVTGVAEDPAGDLWFATYGGGLCRRSADGQEWQIYRADDSGLVNDYVGVVTADANGCVWAVCDARQVDGVQYPGGLCALAPDGTWQTHERSPSEDCIVALEADRDGTLWLRCGGLVVGDNSITHCAGTRVGIDRFHAQHWQSFDGSDWTAYEGDRAALAAWYPHRPARTRLGWALEGDTVWLLETVQMEMFTNPINLPGMPQMPSFGGMGSFGCNYNLVSYDGQAWRERAGMPSPFRYGELAIDGAGNKWVSLVMLGDIVLGGGVSRLDSEADKGEWTIFNQESGMPSNYVIAMSTDSSGNLWVSPAFGGVSRWDGSGWTHFPPGEDGRGDGDLCPGIEDSQGRLWFTSKAGVVTYDGSDAG